MQTRLVTELLGSAKSETANQILRRCVHCGFCNTNCPTFQLTGNELDGPRGRIYQIKNILEGTPPSQQHLLHLDRCLLCQSCETHCPSGVEYGKLLELGRSYTAKIIKRSLIERIRRWFAVRILSSKKRFQLILLIARIIKPILPKNLQCQIPLPPKRYKLNALKSQARRIVMLEGCVEAATAPDIQQHCIALLDKLGIETIVLKDTCCAALPYHIEDEVRANEMIKNNIEKIIPHLENGAEAVVSSASGCGNFMKSWHQLSLHHIDSDKAVRVATACRDISEVIAAEPFENLTVTNKKVVFQCPCSMQHGQKIAHTVTHLLSRCDITLMSHKDPHLCCGSAGYYSLTQSAIATTLRRRKLESLLESSPDIIVTANIGCQLHLQSESPIPVMHWTKLFH